MDVSSRVLSELASREAALDAQIETARQEAAREIEAAQAEAARIIANAETQAHTMQTEFDGQLTAESDRIRAEARTKAQTEADATRSRATARIQQAAEHILRAVLP